MTTAIQTTTWLSDIASLPTTADWQRRLITQIQTLGMPHKKQEVWRYAPLDLLFEKIATPSLGSVKTAANAEDMAPFQEVETNVFVPATVLAPSSFQRLKATSKRTGKPFETNISFAFENGWQQHHVVLNTEAGADAVLKIDLSATDGAGHVLVHLTLAQGANVRVEIIGQGLGAPVMVTLRAVQGNNGNLKVVSYIQDSPWFMLDLGDAINGTESDMTLAALSLVRENQYAGVMTNIRHNIGHSTSKQLVKAVLYDTAVTEYNGAVFVATDAQKTDSKQSNPNLVLSDTARALSRPQLRIYADDVKCAHGATMGQLDPEPLFYLASRGFSHQECISIVLAGFTEEVLDQMSDPTLRKKLLADAIRFLRT
jgi:Fe-S cluster assembly scaffold protein SufB